MSNETSLSRIFPATIRFSARATPLVMDLARFFQAVLAHEGGHAVAMTHYPIFHLFWTDLDFFRVNSPGGPFPSILWRRRSCMVNGLIAKRYTESEVTRGSDNQRESAAAMANDPANYVTYDTVDWTQIRLHAKHR